MHIHILYAKHSCLYIGYQSQKSFLRKLFKKVRYFHLKKMAKKLRFLHPHICRYTYLPSYAIPSQIMGSADLKLKRRARKVFRHQKILVPGRTTLSTAPADPHFKYSTVRKKWAKLSREQGQKYRGRAMR